MKEILDSLSNFGFTLFSENEGIKTYRAKVNFGYAELTVLENIFTLVFFGNDFQIMVANRYKVASQEQLDFLLLNGRLSSVISVHSLKMDEKTLEWVNANTTPVITDLDAEKPAGRSMVRLEINGDEIIAHPSVFKGDSELDELKRKDIELGLD